MIIASPQIVLLLGGKEFIAAKTVLILLAIFFLIRMFLLSGQTIILANHQEKKVLKIYSLSFVIVTGLSFLLIPWYSYIGAAIALIIGELFIFTTISLLSKKHLKSIAWSKIFVKTVLPTIIMSVLLLIILNIPYLKASHFQTLPIYSQALFLIVIFLIFIAPIAYNNRAKIKQLSS
ncbi:unnamed protein product [marine sediment metagenome]|uniref:Uncharacterized protein n=1 Tax=marine sediment metagenome TaxID=412755 RepID=X1BN61_9ZZZZ